MMTIQNLQRTKLMKLQLASEKEWARRHDNIRSLDENDERGAVFVRSRDNDSWRETYVDYPADTRIGFFSQRERTEKRDGPGTSSRKSLTRLQQAAVSHPIELSNGESAIILPEQLLFQELELNDAGLPTVKTEQILDLKNGTITEFNNI